MFDPASRYADVETATLATTDADGTVHETAYKRRRFLPPADLSAPLLEHTAIEGDRVDTITARYLGDPADFWRVCDANTVLRPDELVERAGRTVVIGVPKA